MTDTVGQIESVVERLNEQVQALERRVALLEGRGKEAGIVEPGLAVAPPSGSKPPATWQGLPSAQSPGGAVPVLGKAVLGIAGAYLLRAIAESGSAPKVPVLVAAILYAGWWMVRATRIRDTNFFASVTYATTSAMILSPLLWESTVRFHVLSPIFTGSVLVAFVVVTLGLSWKPSLEVLPWVATLGAVVTALTLIFATHDLVPLTAALLAVAFAIEGSTWWGRVQSLRMVPAVAADLAISLLVFILTSSEGVPEGYRTASGATIAGLCLALLAIYGASIGIRSFGQRHRMTILEITQGVLAFALAAYGALRATKEAAAPTLGVLFLLLAAVCYWGALSRFTEEEHTRNRRVSATWAAALLVAGCLLLVPGKLQVPFLCLAAVVTAFEYPRTAKVSLGLHASVFLAAAAAVSTLPEYVMNALAGNVPGAPYWDVWVLAISAAVCYALGSKRPEERVRRRLLWVIPALLAGFASAAVVVAAVVAVFAGRVDLGASKLSVIRTVTNCALALGLGFLGSRWHRVELGWVAYAAVAFGTLKLLFEDLRFGNAASLVVSLLFYGLILILLPRLTQVRKSETS